NGNGERILPVVACHCAEPEAGKRDRHARHGLAGLVDDVAGDRDWLLCSRELWPRDRGDECHDRESTMHPSHASSALCVALIAAPPPPWRRSAVGTTSGVVRLRASVLRLRLRGTSTASYTHEKTVPTPAPTTRGRYTCTRRRPSW